MKHLIRQVAKETGISERIVNEYIRDMFKGIRKTIVSDTYSEINIEGLGIFKVKERRLFYFMSAVWCDFDKGKELIPERIEMYGKIVLAYYNKLNWKTYDRRSERRKIFNKG